MPTGDKSDPATLPPGGCAGSPAGTQHTVEKLRQPESLAPFPIHLPGHWRKESLDKEPITLLSSKDFDGMADQMCSEVPGRFLRGTVCLEHFADGTPNARIDASQINGRDCVLVCSYNPFEVPCPWLGILGLIYAVPRYAARSFVVVLPFFPTGTMERVNVEGEIATAMTFARMLSATPQAQCGHVQFVFFDIHALQQRFYFADGILPRLVSAIPLLLRELAGLMEAGDKVAIAFPDDGAQKRFGPMFAGHFPMIVCQKVRDGEKRIVKIGDGQEHIQGSHVIIVDDLVQTGGTLINANLCIRDHGATKVSAYATHCVFPKESWNRFVDRGEGAESPRSAAARWETFWVTNSIPWVAESVRKVGKPFVVLSLAPVLAQMLVGAV